MIRRDPRGLAYHAPMKRTITILGFIAVSLTAGPTRAQDSLQGRAYPERRMTLTSRTLRLDLGPPGFGLNDSGYINGPFGSPYGFRVGRDRVHDSSGTRTSRFMMLGLGFGYGVTHRFELGMNVAPLILDASAFALHARPADGEGFGNLTGYLRYAFVHERRVQVGIQAAVSIPTGTDFGLGVAIPVNVNAGSGWRIETGVELESFFGNDLDGDGDAWLTLDVPVALTKGIGRRGFVGARSGVLLRGLTDESDVTLPVGGQGGFTLYGTHVAADFKASFQYFFITNDAPGTRWSQWQTTLGVNLFLRP